MITGSHAGRRLALAAINCSSSRTMKPFGQLLTKLRRRAGLGLRTFAELIAERASTVSAVEVGERPAWQRQDKLDRIADVLGLVGSSPFCEDFYHVARSDKATEPCRRIVGKLSWWWQTDRSLPLDEASLQELERFVHADVEPVCNALLGGAAQLDYPAAARELSRYSSLTELAAEWRVRRLLGRREQQISAAPVDVESVLENRAGVQLQIVAGLIPRFSIQACAMSDNGRLTLLIDRIVADSRPLASYRELLARCYAPAVLWIKDDSPVPHDWFFQLQRCPDWPRLQRDCERFALSLLLPAGPVLAAAQDAYREVVEQQGWIDTDAAACAVRNRLAEQFAVPPLLIHSRLVRWPCHVYGRIAQALAAQEYTLPPIDWFIEEDSPRQQFLFEMKAGSLP